MQPVTALEPPATRPTANPSLQNPSPAPLHRCPPKHDCSIKHDHTPNCPASTAYSRNKPLPRPGRLAWHAQPTAVTPSPNTSIPSAQSGLARPAQLPPARPPLAAIAPFEKNFPAQLGPKFSPHMPCRSDRASSNRLEHQRPTQLPHTTPCPVATPPVPALTADTPQRRQRRHLRGTQYSPHCHPAAGQILSAAPTPSSVTRLMLLLSGDVEPNPGPPHTRQSVERWLGVSDAAAAAILQLFADIAKTVEAGMSAGTAVNPSRHRWNHPMLRALADCVDARLVLVQGVQALTAAAAAHLPASAVFEAHRNEYYPNVRPFQHNFGWPAVKQCNPDGNCNFGTALLAVLGTEDWGRTALRLRNLLHFLPNSELYHAALGDMDRDAARTDFREGIFHDLARTGSYQTKLTCAISATVLQCPVVLYNPGLTTHRNRQYECGYMPPLFVHDPDYQGKVPIVMTWAQANGGKAAAVEHFDANHFEPMFFGTVADYAALQNPRHPLYPPSYFSSRHPRRPWDTRRNKIAGAQTAAPADATRLQHLTPDQRQIISATLLHVEGILRRDHQVWELEGGPPPSRHLPLAPLAAAARLKRKRPSGGKHPQAPAKRTGGSQGLSKHASNSQAPNRLPASKRPAQQGLEAPLPMLPPPVAPNMPGLTQLDIKKFLHRKKHNVVDVHKTGRVGGACHGTTCTPTSEADARPQPTASQPAAPGTCTTPQGTDRHFTVVTYNPMGGSTTDLDIQHVAEVQQPDVLVIPELKICSRQRRRNLYRRLLGREYKLIYSLLPGGSKLSSKATQRQKAGVLIAVAKRHAGHNSAQEVPVPPHLNGHLVHVRLAPPHGRPLEVIGVYMPTAADEQEVRQAANQYIERTALHCAQHGTTLLAAGDWNATLLDCDRSTGTRHSWDLAHRRLAAAAALVPAGGLSTSNRAFTYRQHAEINAIKSRIDDVLVCLPTLPMPPATAEEWQPAGTEVMDITAGSGDHHPLVVRLPRGVMGYTPPTTHPPDNTSAQNHVQGAMHQKTHPGKGPRGATAHAKLQAGMH